MCMCVCVVVTTRAWSKIALYSHIKPYLYYTYSLLPSLSFGGQVRHYRLYYEPQEKCHLVGKSAKNLFNTLLANYMYNAFIINSFHSCR